MVVLKEAGPREPRCDADRIGFRMAAALHRFDVTRFCASQYSGTLGPLMADARPAADDGSMAEVAWRPVEEYGTGYGEGFTKGWELGCANNALSNLRDEIDQAQQSATCGADPCCGQRATSAGCIFAPKK